MSIKQPELWRTLSSASSCCNRWQTVELRITNRGDAPALDDADEVAKVVEPKHVAELCCDFVLRSSSGDDGVHLDGKIHG